MHGGCRRGRIWIMLLPVRSVSGPEGRMEADGGMPAGAERTECRRMVYAYIQLSLLGVN